mmetsp:Transcript_6917/g.13802  ORF Transcript_6917/g.13802 Transcript_6917/m.13802 type:complete len:203 (+) Transcript_6917:48-656(+)
MKLRPKGCPRAISKRPQTSLYDWVEIGPLLVQPRKHTGPLMREQLPHEIRVGLGHPAARLHLGERLRHGQRVQRCNVRRDHRGAAALALSTVHEHAVAGAPRLVHKAARVEQRLLPDLLLLRVGPAQVEEHDALLLGSSDALRELDEEAAQVDRCVDHPANAVRPQEAGVGNAPVPAVEECTVTVCGSSIIGGNDNRRHRLA